MEKELYRVKEFCQVYAISRASFYREVAAGRLVLVKRGSTSLVTRIEAQRWLASLSQKVSMATHASMI